MDLLNAIKTAALNALENSKPCDLRYGTVISTAPLSIRVTETFILPQSALIVPERLTDYELTVSTEGFGWVTASADAHTHGISQTKKVKVLAALKPGDRVALLRQSGGQYYLILDRLKGGEG